jgi:hypothetical protein
MTMVNDKPNLPLTDEQLEHLVEKVTEKVIENVYTSVGKSVVTKFFWVVGLAAISLVTYFAGVGHIKIGS